MGQPPDVEDGKRYRIKIDGRSYYVVLTDQSISVAFAFENRQDEAKTRSILEQFCNAVSKIMTEDHDVSKIK